MDGEGMVAVVRGLRDAGLAVTVVDGDKRFTLMPNTDVPQRVRENITDYAHRETGAQAVDGRYTSTYQAMHCNVTPTSPPVQLSEFPPQRSNVYPGHSNFEVGGQGSGETYAHNKCTNLRGTMNCPERGCVCSQRESNAFADSLRKYPPFSPDRSTEFVERLLNNSQTMNVSKSQRHQSPTRLSDAPYTMESKASPRAAPRDPDISVKVRQFDDSPTKEKKKDFDYRDIKFPLEYDVRCLRDMSKRVKDCVRASCPFRVPTYPTIRESNNHSTYNSPNGFVSSTNTDSPAAVKMVSREVSTVPRPALTRRTIAVPLTPTSSTAKIEGECCCVPSFNSISCKLIQTTFSPLDLRSTSSSVELNRRYRNMINDRKSKSQQEIRIKDDDFKRDVLELLEDLSICSKSKRCVRNELVKQLIISEKENNKSIKRAKYNLKYTNCRDELDEVTRHIGYSKVRVEGDNYPHFFMNGTPVLITDCELESIIKQWVSNINIKSKDFLGRNLNKDVIINTASQRIKTLIANKSTLDTNLKYEILSVLEDIPINCCCEMRSYINGQIDILFRKIGNNHIQCCNIYKNCEPRSFLLRKKATILTEEEIKNLVRETLADFLERSNMDMCLNLIHAIEDELVDLFIGSFDFIRYGDYVSIKSEIIEILKDVGHISDDAAIHIANILLHNLKEISKEYNFHNIYTVCHSHSKQNSPINKVDFDANVDEYTYQLCEQIEEWLKNLDIPLMKESGFRHVVINDLAGDIVDRHKYLEINPSSRGTDADELENLKFQIFKWINKLVGEDNTETLQHAPDLMQRINSVPVPVLTDTHDKMFRDRCQACCKGKTAACKNKNRLNSPDTNMRNQQGLNASPSIANRGLVNSSTSNFEPRRNNWNQNGNNTTPYESGPRKKWSFHTSSTQLNPALNMSYPRYVPNTVGNRYDGRTSLRRHFIPRESPLEQMRGQPAMVNEPIKDCCPPPKNLSHGQSRIPIPIPPCCTGQDQSTASKIPTVKDLNDEFDEYVKQWVQDIPIIVRNPEEQNFADMARLAIYNGVWKAITKLKLDPAILNNPFLYQDLFDSEIEELLDLLPQTQILEQNKHRLKAQLMEKTATANEQILATAIPSCFKQQLIDILNNHIPKTSRFNESIKEQEEFIVNDLVEDYILFIRYKDVDDTKSDFYKINFLRKVKELAEHLKSTHPEQLKDVDPSVLINNFISAVSRVPVPDNNIIIEEADTILLGMEISNWLSLIALKTNISPLKKLRLTETILRKINEIGKHMNLSDCCTRIELQKVLPKYIEELPLQDDANITFLIEELANRIKNQPKHEARKKVAFEAPMTYDDFSKYRPGCSSFNEPGESSEYESSYMIVGGDIVRNPGPRNWIIPQHKEVSEEQWLSLLEGSKAPSAMRHSNREDQSPGNLLVGQRNRETRSYIVAQPMAGSEEQWLSIAEESKVPAAMWQDLEGTRGSQRPQSPDRLLIRQSPYGQTIPTSADPSGGALYAVPNNAQMPGSLVQETNIQTTFLPQNHTSMHEPQVRQDLSNIQGSPAQYGPFYGPTAPRYTNVTQNYQNANLIPPAEPTSVPQAFINPNLQQMAGGGGMGILGNSQVAGPSTGSSRVVQTSYQPSMGTNKPPDREFYLSTDAKGIQQIIEQSKLQRPQRTLNARSMTDGSYVVGSTGAVDSIQGGLYPVSTPMTNMDPIAATPLVITQSPGYSTSRADYAPVFSTPQQPIAQALPERPKKQPNRYRNVQRSDGRVRRRLNLDDSEYETENENDDLRCICMERHWQSRRRRRFYPPCEVFDPYSRYSPCLSMMHYPYFY